MISNWLQDHSNTGMMPSTATELRKSRLCFPLRLDIGQGRRTATRVDAAKVSFVLCMVGLGRRSQMYTGSQSGGTYLVRYVWVSSLSYCTQAV
jgi:hypothetical protein